jgi:hypothetical protein
MANKNSRKHVDKVLITFGVLTTILLLTMGGLAWWTYSFTSSNVKTELSAQKIYFPSLGSPALASSKIGPYLNQYAGKELLTGPEAKAYADHFIAVHLSEVANGQTYAQVSSESLANPSNGQLKAEAATLFQGETLRGLLLGDAYAFATVGHIAEIVAFALFIGGAVMAFLVLLGLVHLYRFD